MSRMGDQLLRFVCDPRVASFHFVFQFVPHQLESADFRDFSTK